MAKNIIQNHNFAVINRPKSEVFFSSIYLKWPNIFHDQKYIEKCRKIYTLLCPKFITLLCCRRQPANSLRTAGKLQTKMQAFFAFTHLKNQKKMSNFIQKFFQKVSSYKK